MKSNDIRFDSNRQEIRIAIDFGDFKFTSASNFYVSNSTSKITVHEVRQQVSGYLTLAEGILGSFVSELQNLSDITITAHNFERVSATVSLGTVVVGLLDILDNRNVYVEYDNFQKTKHTYTNIPYDDFYTEFGQALTLTVDGLEIDVSGYTYSVDTALAYLNSVFGSLPGVEFHRGAVTIGASGESQTILLVTPEGSKLDFGLIMSEFPFDELAISLEQLSTQIDNQGSSVGVEGPFTPGLKLQEILMEAYSEASASKLSEEAEPIESQTLAQLVNVPVSSTTGVSTSSVGGVIKYSDTGPIYTSFQPAGYADTGYSFPEIGDLEDYSIECFIRIDDTPSENALIVGHDSDGSGFRVELTPERRIVVNGSFYSNTYFDLNRWYHIAFVKDAATGVKFFVDTVVDKAEDGLNIYNIGSSANSVKIGGSPVKAIFPGEIADVRIFNKERAQIDIIADYRLRLYGDESFLMGYYPFLDQPVNDVVPNRGIVAFGDATFVDNPTINFYRVALLSETAAPDVSFLRSTTIDLSPYARASRFEVTSSLSSILTHVEGSTLTIIGNDLVTATITVTAYEDSAPIPDGSYVTFTFNVTCTEKAETYITGGDQVYIDSGFQYHIFEAGTTESLSVTGDPTLISFLLVGGGGASFGKFVVMEAAYSGGGAGGVIIKENMVVQDGDSFSPTIGAGSTTIAQERGGDSEFLGLIAYGGGNGEWREGIYHEPVAGGSIGGHTRTFSLNTVPIQPNSIYGGYGNTGGTGWKSVNRDTHCNGGGGGAGSAGSSRNAGDGIEFPAGSGVYYAAGGRGFTMSYYNHYPGAAGLGDGSYGSGGDYYHRNGFDGALIVCYKPNTDTVSPDVSDPLLNKVYDFDTNDLTITGTPASDNLSTPATLTYTLYSSDTDNLTTSATTVMANGTLESTSVGSLSFTVNMPDSKWVNVVVTDESGNRSIYSQIYVDAVEPTSPIVDTPELTVEHNTTTLQTTITFAKATDNEISQTNIAYRLYKSSTNNLDTDAATVMANGTLVEQLYDVTQFVVDSANPDDWYNVIAADTSDNRSIYTQNQWTLPPANPILVLTGADEVVDDATYRYYKYTTVGTKSIEITTPGTAHILVVGGGGSGSAGAGGAGGVIQSTEELALGSYTVTVGAGGSGAAPNGGNAPSGGNSVFGPHTAIGGGGGGGYDGNGGSGGSGGGGGHSFGYGGNGTTGQGNKGGNANSSISFAGTGGGGGASQEGSNANGYNGGVGGDGIQWIDGNYYGGGGGGGSRTSGSGADGGLGGGGNGDLYGVNSHSTQAVANTGGGGGGFSQYPDGASGIVIVATPLDGSGGGGEEPTVSTSALSSVNSTNNVETVDYSHLALGAVDYTIEGWFKLPNAFSGKMTLFKRDDWNYGVWVDSTTVRVHANPGSVIYYGDVSSAFMLDQQWHHIALVVTGGSSLSLFIDGTLTSFSSTSSVGSRPWGGRVDGPPEFRINNYVSGHDTAGTELHVSDVRIWSEARTAQQITDNKDTRLVGNEPNLLGYWRCGEIVNGQIDDLTLNNANLFITGAGTPSIIETGPTLQLPVISTEPITTAFDVTDNVHIDFGDPS